MRDPWALDPLTQYPTKLHYQLELHDMKNACQQANAVIMNTPSALQAVVNAFRDIPSTKFHCIQTDGIEQDFMVYKANDHRPGTPMKIIHTGLFHAKGAKRNDKPHLFSILRYSVSPINLLTRSPNYLFAAYRKLVQENKIQSDAIRFIFAGAATPEDKQLAHKYGLADITEFKGYLNHQQAIDLLFEADVLFMPLHELKDGYGPLIVPGKTYEYLAARKPILACVPKGDARDFVIKSGLGYVCDPSDINQIAQILQNLLEQHRTSKGIQVKSDHKFIELFDRRRFYVVDWQIYLNLFSVKICKSDLILKSP